MNLTVPMNSKSISADQRPLPMKQVSFAASQNKDSKKSKKGSVRVAPPPAADQDSHINI